HRNIEILKTFLNFLNQILKSDMLRAGFLSCFCRGAFGKHQNSYGLAASVGKGACATHHLIRLFWINTETERNGHGLIELRRREFLQRRDSVVKVIRFFAVHLLGGRAVSFGPFLLHKRSLQELALSEVERVCCVSVA